MPVLKQYWNKLNDWLKASVIALGVLVFAHLFILRWVMVRSNSMYATLLEGDLVGVMRWPVWTGFHRGDIAVFRDPVQDDRSMGRRQLMVKRIVGLPGDKVELRDGRLIVNGERNVTFPKQTSSYMVRLRQGADPSGVLEALDLPTDFMPPEGNMMELPLNGSLVKMLHDRKDVASTEPMPDADGAPSHIFPYSPNFPWNSDDYGPITVPRRGEVVHIDAGTIALYDRIISRYEGNKLENVGNDLLINGVKLTEYTIQQDYYFVLGDSRHYSEDSRYWGFVPADHLLGRASFVLLGKDAMGGVRHDRWFTGLH